MSVADGGVSSVATFSTLVQRGTESQPTCGSHLVAVFGHVRLRPLQDILPGCLSLLLSVSCCYALFVGPVLIPLSLLEDGFWHGPCHLAIGPNNERDKAPPCYWS